MTGAEINRVVRFEIAKRDAGGKSVLDDPAEYAKLAASLLSLFVECDEKARREISATLDRGVVEIKPTAKVKIVDAARLLGVSVRTIHRMIDAGTLKTATTATGKKFLMGESILSKIKETKTGGKNEKH